MSCFRYSRLVVIQFQQLVITIITPYIRIVAAGVAKQEAYRKPQRQ